MEFACSVTLLSSMLILNLSSLEVVYNESFQFLGILFPVTGRKSYLRPVVVLHSPVSFAYRLDWSSARVSLDQHPAFQKCCYLVNKKELRGIAQWSRPDPLVLIVPSLLHIDQTVFVRDHVSTKFSLLQCRWLRRMEFVHKFVSSSCCDGSDLFVPVVLVLKFVVESLRDSPFDGVDDTAASEDESARLGRSS